MEGGGICSFGTLTVNGTVTSNTSTGDSGGGIRTDSAVTINGTVSNNQVSGGLDLRGGGVYLYSYNAASGLTIGPSARITGNSVTGTNGMGGGIGAMRPYVTGATPTTVSGNSASTSCDNYYAEFPVGCVIN